LKNVNEEETIITLTKIEEIKTKMEEIKTTMKEEKMQNLEERRMSKEGILQNKTVNNAVCENIEKLDDELSKQKNQLNNIENNLVIMLSEISNIQERISNNEEKYNQLLKMIRTEIMSIKKVTTEMINIRLSNNEKSMNEMMKDILKKLGVIEEENAELKEQLKEIQTELKKKNDNENPGKPHKSSESNEEHSKKRKPSGSMCT
jgi:chromosome segregation ATPase